MKKQLAIPVLLILVCAGCTAEKTEREYALPETLCGAELETSLYREIFPPGEEIDVDNNFDESGGWLLPIGECYVEVDGEQAIFIDMFPPDPNAGGSNDLSTYVTDLHNGYGDHDLKAAEQLQEGPRETLLWPDFAATGITCEESSTELSAIHMSIELNWVDDDDDYSEPLRTLIGPFFDAQLEQMPDQICTPAT